jgi:hypothetical protein
MLNISNLIKKIAKVTPPNNNCNKNFTSILQPKTDFTVSLITLFDSIFMPIPTNIVTTFKDKKQALTLYKTFVYLKSDPHHNIMMHKKVMNVLIPVQWTKTLKLKAFNFFVEWYKTEALKYNVKVDENTNFTVLYEIYCAVTFGTQQPSVHSVTFLNEGDARSPEGERASLLHTKQKRCDLLVTYNTEGKKTYSLLDILIGRNKEYKGNLVFTKSYDVSAIQEQQKHMLLELQKQKDNSNLSQDDKNLIKEKIMLIEKLSVSNMTPAAQTIIIQEHMISVIPIIRKINSGFNPNMIVFIPENPNASPDTLILAEKIQSFVPYPLGVATPNTEVDLMLSKTLSLYLKYKKPDLNVMSPTERNYCLEIIKKYAPEYYSTLSIS